MENQISIAHYETPENNPFQIFQNERFGKVRVVIRYGKPWFVAKDVCDCLGIVNSRDSVNSLDEDEKGVAIADTLGGKQEISIVSESGLYALIFKSRKPEAKTFKRWVTHEVLPAINATGGYSLNKALPPSAVDKMAMLEIMARSYFSDINQRMLFLDKAFTHYTGESALTFTGVTLIAPATRQLFTPTEIGKWYDMSAHTINNVLEDFGLQKRVSDKWEPTEKGVECGAVMLDTGKAHSDGTPVRQLKWDSLIRDFLDQRLTIGEKC